MFSFGCVPNYYNLSAWDLHASAAYAFVMSLLAVDSDSSCSPTPGDQITTILEVTLPVQACDGLKGLELFLALLLSHGASLRVYYTT
jgi:hypothetical protein